MVSSKNKLTVADKPETAGRTLDGIDPGMRNSVAALVAASDLLAERLGPDHPHAGYAWLIRNESGRLSETLREMETLTMPLPYAAHETDLRPAILEYAAGLSELARARRIDFAAQISDAPLKAIANSTAVIRALESLARWALDTLPRNGALRLHAENAGAEVIIRLVESGPTLPAAFAADIFNPSAIIPGRRAALAPAVCKRIVEHLGGGIEAGINDSGLTVEIRFQAVSKENQLHSIREEKQ